MRHPTQTTWFALLGVLAVIALAGLLTYANHRYASAQPGGSDFMVLWEGTRSFLGEGIDPYSDQMAARIQASMQQQQAVPEDGGKSFTYPLYAIFLVLPFALISDFTIARALWMTVLEFSLIALAITSIRLVRWKVWPLSLAIFVLFSIFFFHALRPLVMGNPSILVALFLVYAFLAIRSGVDEIAGILFGLATIQPQLVLLLLLFVLLWALRSRRWKVPIWAGMTVILLGAIAALLKPDWILQNLLVILRDPTSGGMTNPATAFSEVLPALGGRIGNIVSVSVVILMLVEWWFARSKDFRSFLWAACFTLAASQWSGLRTSPDNFIVLVPGLALVFSAMEERWRGLGRAVSLLSMIGLFAGLWVIFLSSAEMGLLSAEVPLLLIPLPLFLLIALYWVRWWAVQPPNVWYNLMAQDSPR